MPDPQTFVRQTLAPALAALVSSSTLSAAEKNFALRTPSGRQIYNTEARFAEVKDQDRRHLIVELLSGLAPEGHLGMLLGIINVPVKGLEFYSGIAFELNPAVSVPLTVRYMLNFNGFRPYLSGGYIYRRVRKLDVWSHNAFVEVGHKWVLHHTYHLTLGVGLRRPLQVVVQEQSPLRDATIDPQLLNEQIERSLQFVPTFAVRISRAF